MANERRKTPWIAALPTDERARQIATEAIALFVEYRDVHGNDEALAALNAAQEIAEGYGTMLPDAADNRAEGV